MVLVLVCGGGCRSVECMQVHDTHSAIDNEQGVESILARTPHFQHATNIQSTYLVEALGVVGELEVVARVALLREQGEEAVLDVQQLVLGAAHLWCVVGRMEVGSGTAVGGPVGWVCMNRHAIDRSIITATQTRARTLGT